jgi:hypothetical protein
MLDGEQAFIDLARDVDAVRAKNADESAHVLAPSRAALDRRGNDQRTVSSR